MFEKQLKRWIFALTALTLSGCGFHLRGEMPLAEPLHSVYLRSVDPYGTLTRNLEQSLKMSNVRLVTNQSEAQTILAITHNDTSQKLLSVGATQQTRQYKLTASVTFEVSDNRSHPIIESQTLSEDRVITVQSNQILGSSNEANLYFQEMNRSLANAVMYRLSSNQITSKINQAFHVKPATTITKKRRS
ncbi:MAG TPA: LPS assembly lipoprotein LptE [Gammaproteobacteria bacterium]|jgi:LPS-assembly lipoprotein|nr:LPS assembly lipoprotein LptE [Gammaproteobacteria bacterium]